MSKAKTKKFYKKIANKKVRQTKVADGGNYKKAYETYNIERT